MFALLGDITIDVVKNGLQAFNKTSAGRVAEHQVLQGKPRLQKIGPGLQSGSITIGLHQKSGGVDSRIEELEKLTEELNPISFVMGNGRYLGNFICDYCSVVYRVADDRGGTKSAEITLSLKEYAGDLEDDGLFSGLASNFGAIGAQINRTNEWITKASSIYDEVNSALNSGRSILDLGSIITSRIPQLRFAQDAVEMLRGIENAFNTAVNLGGDVLGNSSAPYEVSNTFGSFIDSIDDSHEVTVEMHEISQSIQENPEELEDSLALLEALNNNLVSRNQTLKATRLDSLCEFGLRGV